MSTEQIIYGALETYLLEHVWNMPLTECRRNIVLESISRGRSCVNTINLGCEYTDLPYASSETKSAFYVFAAPKCCMGGLVVDTTADAIVQQLSDHYVDGWLPLDKYLNARPFDLRIHGTYGEWLYRHSVFIKNHPYQHKFLIAVEKKMGQQILGREYNFNKLYMSVYYDSDNDLNQLSVTSKTIECYHPTMSDISGLNIAYNKYANASAEQRSKMMFFIDGRESTPKSITDLSVGQYIEIVTDPDIICDVILDLTDPEQNNMYRSEIDHTYKFIVHIPKEHNPNNYIITHNTCDIFIRPTNTPFTVNPNRSGLYVHRFNTSKRGIDGYLTDDKITQITHNDFGISEKVIQPYMEKINSSEGVIRAVIRRHRKSRILPLDGNYIKLLYMFDDATIIQMLLGNVRESLWFWRATELEHCKFTKMLFDIPVPVTIDTVRTYIQALGYHNTLGIITPKVQRVMLEPANSNRFSVGIPISMLECPAITAIININGRIADPTSYVCIRKGTNIDIFMSNVQVGDEIIVELYEAKTFKADYVSPSAEHPTFTVDAEFDIYEVTGEVIPDGYYVDKYIGNKTCYREVTDVAAVILDNNNGVLTFSSNSYGKTYLICSKEGFLIWNNTNITNQGGITQLGTCKTLTGDSCSDIQHTNILVTEVAWKWDGSAQLGRPVPILHKRWNIMGYLNGRELVDRLDMTHTTIKGTNDSIAGHVVIFNNVSYLDSVNNDYMIVATTDQPYMEYNGFVHVIYNDDQTYQRGDIEEIYPYVYWNANMCNIAVDGEGAFYPNIYDGMVHVSDTVRQGALYLTRGYIPLATKELMDGIAITEDGSLIDEDVARRTAIAEYIREITPPKTGISVIEHSHHICSITMAALVKDVLTGTKQFAYSPDDAYLLKQISEYKSLEPYDPTLSGLVNDLKIHGCDIAVLNNSYTMFDPSAKGSYRQWVCKANHIVLWWNPNEGYRRWELRSSIATLRTLYAYADDPDGSHNPWELLWKNALDGSDVDLQIEISTGVLNLRYIDIFPTYSSDLHVVEDDINLKKAMQVLLPIDDIKDGDTVNE